MRSQMHLWTLMYISCISILAPSLICRLWNRDQALFTFSISPGIELMVGSTNKLLITWFKKTHSGYIKEKLFLVSLIYTFVFYFQVVTKIIKATIPSNLSLKFILQGNVSLIFNLYPLLLITSHPRYIQCQILLSPFINLNSPYQAHLNVWLFH